MSAPDEVRPSEPDNDTPETRFLGTNVSVGEKFFTPPGANTSIDAGGPEPVEILPNSLLFIRDVVSGESVRIQNGSTIFSIREKAADALKVCLKVPILKLGTIDDINGLGGGPPDPC